MERTIYFDYLSGDNHVEEHADQVGSDSMGRQRLLVWLEEQLGIAPFEPERRLFAFYSALRHKLSPQDSIYASFQKSPIGTARVMMSWFDGLTLVGWRGEHLKDKRLARFNVLSGIYDSIVDSLAGRSDALRIECCIKYLKASELQLNKCVLAQPRQLMPMPWQVLIGTLFNKGVEIVESADGGGYRHTSANVKLLSSAGVLDAAHTAAQYLSLNGGDSTDALIVSQYGTSLDQAFAGQGLPSAGFKTTSNARLITQIIPAVMNTLSGQYSLESLVALLSHRLWLGDTILSKKLSKKLASNIGIGNDDWEQAKSELLKESPEVDEWLSAFERGSSDTDLLKKLISETRLKALKVQNPLYQEFARQCQVILDVLAIPDTELTLVQRFKLLKELGVGQLPTTKPLAQVSQRLHCHGLTEPSHLKITPDVTIWIGPYYEPAYTLPDWYQPEFDALSEHYDVFSRADDLMLLRHCWGQFLSRVNDHLVIIDFDGEANTHPLFDELLANLGLQRKTLADYLAGHKSDSVNTEYEKKPLPAYARVARLNQALPLGEKMSASRLEKLLFKTSDFVFNYSAKLRDSSIQLPQIGNRERGLYAHALFEHYFKEHPTPDTWQDIEDWYERHADDIFKKAGLVFLGPGAHYDRQVVQQQAGNALKVLVSTFKKSGVVRVTPELDVNGWRFRVGGYDFAAAGSLDLVLEKADGSVMVLDAKWANSQGKQYTNALERGFATQLYAYAAIYHQKHGRWPNVGYFIIKDNEFLINDTGFLISDDIDPLAYKFSNLADAWRVIDELAKWRFSQLSSGDIELNNPGCEVVDGISYPEDEDLRAVISAYRAHHKGDKDYAGDKFSDYRHLLGWRHVSAE
ncbi:MAG: Uncharacterized protein AWU56_2277 [Idiomarina sp. T82-3]|jgi:hypothetical protein|uniref:PD-(D/E)XK nuclease family protein n=1 Tax=Idiomarina TaxID=135575 RepID=UPI00079A5725|nr:PD-(D/E)XK nuclease family protein [Idiomarina sp. T82-3]KXS34186.1 MAG: Uncharacterized protein AWU56_2277 [Idiomarina sp. T82-3]